VIDSKLPSSVILIWINEMAYVAVSSPILAKLISTDLLLPSKTTLLGVMRRLPWAHVLKGKKT
jgi:hypothetical protein